MTEDNDEDYLSISDVSKTDYELRISQLMNYIDNQKVDEEYRCLELLDGACDDIIENMLTPKLRSILERFNTEFLIGEYERVPGVLNLYKDFQIQKYILDLDRYEPYDKLIQRIVLDDSEVLEYIHLFHNEFFDTAGDQVPQFKGIEPTTFKPAKA